MEDGRLNLARGGGGVRDVSGRRLQRGRAGIAQYRCFTRNDAGKSTILNILAPNDSS